MFRANNFDKLLDKATSNLRLDPDWPTILQICDLIRQNDCSPKNAVSAIKKKLYSQNPHQAMFALLTLESIVKNCGPGVHDEVTSKGFCEMIRDLAKTTQHENLRNKILELIQAWAFAFRNTPRYRAVQDTVNILKAEGYKFPTLKESDAMFSADTAPEWAEGSVCHRCRVAFSIMVRQHHCRACGQVFCQQCSSKTSTLPKFGIEKEVRVCDACYDKVSRPPSTTAKLDIVDTSSDYGPSQPQKRAGGKTAEELQEEEELQLALALSQSEAEQKEKEKQRPRTYIAPDPTPHPTVSPTPSSVSASPEHSGGTNSELSRYLDRNYWEQRLARDPSATPTAPADHGAQKAEEYAKPTASKTQEDDAEDKEIDEFIETLKSQVEIFVNRMKSNSSRGRSIANDTSVQSLFMNITAMHSRLLRYIQLQDDKRVYLESLQDKVTQVRDSRAALDTLRAEHCARVAAAAEAAERQRQLQMAHKLQAMRKKKHEYLQYQRQLALQRVQEQEREMQMRQEQQKHQYMMSSGTGYYMPGVSMHQFQPGFPNQPIYSTPSQYHQIMPQVTNEGPNTMPGMPQISQANTQIGINSMSTLTQSIPQMNNTYPMSTAAMPMPMSQSQLSSQPSMANPNTRPQLAQQLPLQQQMIMQQMAQMRLPMQPGVNQLIQPNGIPGANVSQQNGQPIQQKMSLPNQPQQPNQMMPMQSIPAQNSMNTSQINPNNPMLGMQIPNMRMPIMANQSNANQQVPVPGYPQSMPNPLNNQVPGVQIPSLQQQSQIMSGQPMMPPQNITSQSQNAHVQLNNQNMPAHVQIPQPQGQQIHQTQHQQVSQGPSIPIQGQPLQAGQQINMHGQNFPIQGHPPQNQGLANQGQQIINQQHGPQGQIPHNQPQQMFHGQQIGHPMQGQMPQIQGQQVSPAPSIPQGVPNSGPTAALGQPINLNQSAPHIQTIPQNISGQPILNPGAKLSQPNFINVPPAQQQSTAAPQVQQAHTPVKSENNNNSTAELISFD